MAKNRRISNSSLYGILGTVIDASKGMNIFGYGIHLGQGAAL